ncbi:MAG: hypothetical protein KC519_10495 [Anaerolineae bacterium]|nr:hypothetical protein [Anaerolineae bacterium]
MDPIVLGILLGLVYGVVDIIPMLRMEFPDKRAAITGAFINRFAIGFLVPNSLPTLDPILRGLLLGTVLSLPDAIITKAYVPIMLFGVVGGLIVGVVTRLVGIS